MPYKDPDKMREYQRDYQRQRRSAEVKQPENKPLTHNDYITAAGVRDLIADVIAEVRTADVDIIVKARAVGYLCGVALKAIEISDLESRITALEEGGCIN